MIVKRKPLLFVVLAALAIFALATDANAWCFGTHNYGVAYRAYSPVSYQAYSPVAYTTYRPYSGWYPGYWLDRARYTGWGGGYTASYAPAYATYYRPAYHARYRPAYYTSYAPATSCSTCTTYYAPSCTTGCDPCGTVTRAVYFGSGCSTCGVVTTSAIGTRPTFGAAEDVPLERSVEKPADANDVEPEPADETFDGNASHLDAPRLFNPKDKTAQKSGAPVRTAEYRKPVAGQRPVVRNISVTRQQAFEDAAGWTSASQ